MTKLTKKYIYEHQNDIHTYESFGRAISEQILHAASEQAEKNDIERANVDAKFTIEAYEPLACIRICVNINGVLVCYHV